MRLSHGGARERATYEDLRQALARYLVEERSYPRDRLLPRHAVSYEVDGEQHAREADIVMSGVPGEIVLMLVFCPGQVLTPLLVRLWP